MEHEREQPNLLADAVARNLPAVVSLPSQGLLMHCKSRFLSECERGIWLEADPAQRLLVNELIGCKRPAGVSFKTGTKRATFVAELLELNQQHLVNAGTRVEAVLMARPTEVKTVQRRSHYRVRVTPDTEGFHARVWRIPEHAILRDRPMASLEMIITLRDLSQGGMGVLVASRPGGEPVRLVPNERLRIELKHPDGELLIEGRLRHVPAVGITDPKAPVRAGVQFKKLEDDLEGRQTLGILTKILGALQREEVRRMRLGIA